MMMSVHDPRQLLIKIVLPVVVVCEFILFVGRFGSGQYGAFDEWLIALSLSILVPVTYVIMLLVTFVSRDMWRKFFIFCGLYPLSFALIGVVVLDILEHSRTLLSVFESVMGSFTGNCGGIGCGMSVVFIFMASFFVPAFVLLFSGLLRMLLIRFKESFRHGRIGNFRESIVLTHMGVITVLYFVVIVLTFFES